MIVLSTTAATIDAAVDQVADQARWIDGVELRVDLLSPDERGGLARFPAAVRSRVERDLSLICTVRRESDGGRWSSTEAERVALLRGSVEAGFDFVDLESDLPSDGPWAALASALEARGVRVIRSIHDFAGVPDDLAATIRSLPRGPREIAKAAVTPRSTADLARIVEAVRDTGEGERIILGMGEYGLPTRLLPAVLGNFLTFASAPGRSAAPGHVTPEELVTRYRLPVQRRTTAVFAVIGNPIAHSRSPAYHNRRFAEDGVDAVYVPVLVDDVDAFFRVADRLPLLGFSVTIPHKVAVMRHLSEPGEDVRAAEACNTVVRGRTGWRGMNTDVVGFLAPLLEVLDRPLDTQRVLVVGAGGAARGVVYALLKQGARVVVWNRTRSRADRLARELGRLTGGRVTVPGGADVTAAEADAVAREVGLVDLVVNTTSVGMHGEGDPAPWYAFSGSETVYDIVYTPPETPLIRRALAAGARVVTGDRMFDAQAAAQYELYRALATGDARDA